MTALAGVLSFGAAAPEAERALRAMLGASRRPPHHELRAVEAGPAWFGTWEEPGGGALLECPGLLCALDGYAAPSSEAGVDGPTAGPAAVVAAHRSRGAALGDCLAGNFAAALWSDKQSRLVLVRDQGATRGLFFTTRAAGMLLWASEPRALLAALRRPPEVDTLHLAGHMAGISLEDAERTAWEGVQRVPAEHVLEVRPQGRARLIRYSAILAQPKIVSGDWPEVMRSRLADAADRAVAGEERGGIALSGGLDSNAVAAVLTTGRGAGREPYPLHGLTFEFPAWPSADEREIVAQAVRRLGIEHEYIDASACWPLHDYPHTAADEDLPSPSFPSRGWPLLFERARAAGAPTILTGHGSDHLLVPSPLRFVELTGGPWHRYAAERRGFAALHGGGPGLPLGLAARTVALRHAPQLARLARLPLPPTLPRAFARESGLFPELIRVGASTGAATGRMRAARLTNAHAAQRLNEHFDALAREYHCDLRYPFFDRDVMATAMRIPVGDIHHGGWMKVVLRRMLRGLAPDAVVDKPRPTAHTELFRYSLGDAGVPALRALLTDSRAARLGALDTGAWWRGRDAWLSGEGSLPPLLAALTAEIWLRRAAGEPLPEAAG